MKREDKEDVVADLAERLRATESLLVADYRGLTNAQLVDLRARLRASGGQLKVVKNTLTRRAAEEAGTESLLALLEGPTAIAFIETDGDPVGVAKALADTARDTKVLALRGGILSGRSIGSAEIEELAKLPAPEVVKSQLVGVIVAPLTQLVGLLAAPLRDLLELVDARIEQLGGVAETEAPAEPSAEDAEPVAAAETETPQKTDDTDSTDVEEPVAAAETETPQETDDTDTTDVEEPAAADASSEEE